MSFSRFERAAKPAAGLCRRFSGKIRARHGQSLIETCIVVGLICLLFMAAFQVSQVFAARDILHHSAARGARARTVGFNYWMVIKCMRVAAIPNAGRMVTPDYQGTDSQLSSWMSLSPGEFWDQVVDANPQSQQFPVEESRIPDYLGSYWQTRASHILDYANWDTVHCPLPAGDDTFVQARVYQDFPLWVPLRETFYGSDSARLAGSSEIENYYPIYLDDMGW